MAFVAAALFLNAVVLWALYRRLSQSASHADRMKRTLSAAITTLRGALQHAEIISGRATMVSSRARRRVDDLSVELDQANNWFHYGMAKLDFELNRISSGINKGTEKVQSVVSGPLFRAGSIAQALRAALEFLTLYRHENDER